MKGMETVVLVLLAIVVALVAVDAVGRLDERHPPAEPPSGDATAITTQKIIVDLTKRR